jgi:hypothetical protein
MNPSKKITRHTIPNGETPDFLFLGIVSAEPDYRLSVMLNRCLGSDFRKDPENIIAISDKGKNPFSCFISTRPALKLVSNKNEKNVLLRRLDKIDFLLVMSGSPDRRKTDELADIIRKIPEVTAVFVFASRETSDRNVSLLAL